MEEKKVSTLEEFEEEAARWAISLAPRAVGATLVTLSGELGAGKTAFVKAAARALGVSGIVNSPTFVLEKIYELPPLGSETSKWRRIVHIDAYRLEKGSDLVPLKFEETMQDAGTLIFFEWPEKVIDALPEAAVKISIRSGPGGARTLSYA